MKRLVLFGFFSMLQGTALAYNNFGPIGPGGGDGLIYVDLGGGGGSLSVGGEWYQCYGTPQDNALNHYQCSGHSDWQVAYYACYNNHWVNITCHRTR